MLNGESSEKQYVSDEIHEEPEEDWDPEMLHPPISVCQKINQEKTKVRTSIKSAFLNPSVFALGLWLPDFDLLALPILNHRSILTHSILIPWLLHKFFRNCISELGIGGLMLGSQSIYPLTVFHRLCGLV